MSCPPRTGATLVLEPALSPVSEPLAPGAQVFVGEGRRRRAGGIAAVLVLDGRLHLLTCGHLFPGAGSTITSARAAGPIAELRRNYLLEPDPLDAAVCELTREGVRLLAASTSAPTWLRGHRAPRPDLDAATAMFWPTHAAGSEPLRLTISAHRAATIVLFPGGPHDGFIEVSSGVIPGDSGSLLAADDLYLGICSGQVQERWSYFTPITDVLCRLCGDHQEVTLWHPDDDFAAL